MFASAPGSLPPFTVAEEGRTQVCRRPHPIVHAEHERREVVAIQIDAATPQCPEEPEQQYSGSGEQDDRECRQRGNGIQDSSHDGRSRRHGGKVRSLPVAL